MDRNVDYKEMYLKMARAVEKAIRTLHEVQLACEEQYLEETENESIPPKIIEIPQIRETHPH